MEEVKNKLSEFFSGIHLDEATHRYTLGEEVFKISVSGLIKPYYFPTDWDNVKSNVALKLGITKEQVQINWDLEAKKGCNIGDKTHIFGENYVLSNFKLEPVTGYEKAIVKFWKELPKHIVPIKLELKMYHKLYRFAGTADIILYNTLTGKIIIADYKTNKDLFKNFQGQRMKYPFSHLFCSPFGHYNLQLSFYQILIEQVPNVSVENRVIIWLLPDGTYKLYETADYSESLKHELSKKGI